MNNINLKLDGSLLNYTVGEETKTYRVLSGGKQLIGHDDLNKVRNIVNRALEQSPEPVSSLDGTRITKKGVTIPENKFKWKLSKEAGKSLGKMEAVFDSVESDDEIEAPFEATATPLNEAHHVNVVTKDPFSVRFRRKLSAIFRAIGDFFRRMKSKIFWRSALEQKVMVNAALIEHQNAQIERLQREVSELKITNQKLEVSSVLKGWSSLRNNESSLLNVRDRLSDSKKTKPIEVFEGKNVALNYGWNLDFHRGERIIDGKQYDKDSEGKIEWIKDALKLLGTENALNLLTRVLNQEMLHFMVNNFSEEFNYKYIFANDLNDKMENTSSTQVYSFQKEKDVIHVSIKNLMQVFNPIDISVPLGYIILIRKVSIPLNELQVEDLDNVTYELFPGLETEECYSDLIEDREASIESFNKA